MAPAPDPRTVEVTKGDETHMVTPEVARVLLGQGWSIAGANSESELEAATAPLLARIADLEEANGIDKATAPLKERIAALEQQLLDAADRHAALEAAAATAADTGQGGNEPGAIPRKADDVIAWIGQDPDRARAALDVENATGGPRKTVADHIDAVLAVHPTPNNPADTGQGGN